VRRTALGAPMATLAAVLTLSLVPHPSASAVGAVSAAAAGSRTLSREVTDPRLDPLVADLDRLAPDIAVVQDDRPPVERHRCHARTAFPWICTFGHKPKVMVAFGDSHMTQWFSALRWAARVAGYRLLWASKPGCPAPMVAQPFGECMVWRKALLDRLSQLPRIDLAVIGGSSWLTMLRPGTQTAILSSEERAEQWRIGMNHTIRRLSPNTRRFMVIRDTPVMSMDVPTCLRSTGGDTRPCSRPRWSALHQGFWRAERSLAKRYARVSAVQLSSWFCASGMCRPVTDSLMVRFRDDDHLTNTFATAMSGLMTRQVRRASR
jgi:hypothetical protein